MGATGLQAVKNLRSLSFYVPFDGYLSKRETARRLENYGHGINDLPLLWWAVLHYGAHQDHALGALVS